MTTNLEAAFKAANDIQGTCDSIGDHVTDEQQADEAFMDEFGQHAECCDSCGWWFGGGELNQNSRCESCGENEGDDDEADEFA